MSQSNGLPEGWVMSTLAEVGQWCGGGTPSTANESYWKDGTIPWISPKDMKSLRIADSEYHISRLATDETNVKPFPPGTVLVVVRSGILSRTLPVAVCGVSATMNQDLKGIKPFEPIYPLFVAYYLIGHEQPVLQQCSKDGTTVASIEVPRLKAFPIRLPPADEQRRIVAKIEEHFSDLDAGVSALERVKANLKRYRAAVLQAAVAGRLTEAWRAKHPDLEPAWDLLGRILTERRRKWDEAQLAKYAEGNKEPPKGWRAKYSDPGGPDVATLPNLPEGWCWASLGALLSEPLRNGHSARASGDGTGIRTLTLTAVTVGDFSEENTKFTIAKPEDVEDLWLQPGDFLIERSNTPELVGTARLYRGPAGFAVFPDLLIRVRTLAVLVKSYIDVVLQSDGTRTFFRRRAKGLAGSMPKIDQGTILRLPVPLPPLAEQAEIAEEVERRLSIIEEVEAQVETNLRRAARLRQCILKRAFEGRLVPQDPTDEPADKLLERIRQERTARNGDTETPKRPQGRRVRRKPKTDHAADGPGGTG
jgi:type I restriction enzyme, S subunit